MSMSCFALSMIGYISAFVALTGVLVRDRHSKSTGSSEKKDMAFVINQQNNMNYLDKLLIDKKEKR